MGEGYSGVSARKLFVEERWKATTSDDVPLVIEPDRAGDLRCLETFLGGHSSRLVGDISKHGAVLLRGFHVESPREFERQMLRITEMRPISDVFMAEPGRDRVKGTKFVLHTNTQYKTGGGLGFMSFHSENFYTTDVPRFICFFCIKPSSFGGETGLLDMVGVYRDLPARLKARLEAEAFFCNYILLKDIQTKYGLARDDVEVFCASHGLPVSIVNGESVVLIYKPCVFVHPVENEKCLVVNLSVELERFGLKSLLLQEFACDFHGLPWAVHRFAWRNPWLETLVHFAQYPMVASRMVFDLLTARRVADSDHNQIRPKRVGQEFSEADLKILAASVRRNVSSFKWRRGDILLIDNLKMAHSGMPGFGTRELCAMIFDPVPITKSALGSGLYYPPNAHTESLGEKLGRLNVMT
jgi:alpha-ketoglutarate-dependent taurine dioxygenase